MSESIKVEASKIDNLPDSCNLCLMIVFRSPLGIRVCTHIEFNREAYETSQALSFSEFRSFVFTNHVIKAVRMLDNFGDGINILEKGFESFNDLCSILIRFCKLEKDQPLELIDIFLEKLYADYVTYSKPERPNKRIIKEQRHFSWQIALVPDLLLTFDLILGLSYSEAPTYMTFLQDLWIGKHILQSFEVSTTCKKDICLAMYPNEESNHKSFINAVLAGIVKNHVPACTFEQLSTIFGDLSKRMYTELYGDIPETRFMTHLQQLIWESEAFKNL